MLISIIIPVYNAKKYLERCLDSVILSLENAAIKGEILLVDNGSTDGSLDILKKYKKANSNVRVLKCKNPGAAATRNYGVKFATGRYIWFVDADDTISPDAVSKLVEEAELKKADLVMLGEKKIYENGKSSYLSAVTPDEKNYKSRFIRYGMGPTQVLIRRAWWNEHNLAFCEGMIHEDMELMSALILDTDNFAAVDEPLYYYYQNPGSVLHKANWDPHYFDIFPVLSNLYKKFEDKKSAKKYHAELEWFFIWNLLIDSVKDFKKFPEGKPGLARSRKMLKEYFPHWRHNKFLKQKPLKLRLRVFLNYWGI